MIDRSTTQEIDKKEFERAKKVVKRAEIGSETLLQLTLDSLAEDASNLTRKAMAIGATDIPSAEQCIEVSTILTNASKALETLRGNIDKEVAQIATSTQR